MGVAIRKWRRDARLGDGHRRRDSVRTDAIDARSAHSFRLCLSFRVVQEIFTDTAPKETSDDPTTSTEEDKRAPYMIIGSISEPGLGLKSWWD